MRHPILRWIPWLVAAVALLTVVAEADARVGGGGGFSGGGSRGGGSFRGTGGGSSGDGMGLLLHLLLRLAFEHPVLALVIAVIATAVYIQHARHANQAWSHTTVEGHTHGAPVVRHHHTPSAWDTLAQRDTGLSEPVLLDFVQLVVRRAWAAAPKDDWQALLPFVSPAARQALTHATQGLEDVQDVILAASRIVDVRLGRDTDRLAVAVTHGHTETKDGREHTVYVESSWVFTRDAEAVSLPPEAVHRLGCPSCGAAVQCTPQGACEHCGTPITAGQLQWQASEVQIQVRRSMSPPELRPHGAGAAEPSFDWPSVVAPDLPVALRAFRGRHPDFDGAAWEARIHHAFSAMQTAWGANRWADARPFCSDNAWNTLRFWMVRYARAGLRNRLEDPRILRMQVVKVGIDAWYEAITVRLWAELRDWTEDADGRIVSGDPHTPHRFSEYWTFVRAVGSGDASGDPTACPSCGAPLDNVNAAGTCGYCDSVITTGAYDWVLSRIDQCEVYRG